MFLPESIVLVIEKLRTNGGVDVNTLVATRDIQFTTGMGQNIVLVTIDSLRADHCSFMGYVRETTPTLDAMAADGISFQNAVAPGPTTPESMPPTFTGRYPVEPIGEHGDRLETAQQRIRAHMRATETLPERLSRLGYTTGAFTPNPWTSRYFGFDKGFDQFQDYMSDDVSSSLWQRMLEGRNPTVFKATRLLLSWLQRENVFKSWTAFYDDVVTWTERASEPFFAWVFLLDTHFPYLAGNTYRTQARWRTYEANLRLYLEDQDTPYSPRVHEQLETAYDDSIRYVDAFFERLRRDLDDDTVFVVHGDHGEAFGEHGTYTHHHELYEENIHVPLVVSGGGTDTRREPVSLRSLPTLVTSLAASGTVPEASELFIASKTNEGETLAVRGDRMKYIDDGSAGELYDLQRGEDSRLSNTEVEELCKAVVRGKREAEVEEKRLKGAIRSVINESEHRSTDRR